jgi:hypothetical protein
VERNVDTGKRNRSETSLESDETSLLLEVLGLLDALVDDLAEVFLDLVERHSLGEFREINLLNLEEVENVGEGLKTDEVTSDNVLLTFDVVVDDFDEDVATTSDGFDNLTKSGVSERFSDPRRVDGDHTVGRTVLRVTLDSTLHGDTSVEDDVDESRNGKNVGDRSESRVFSERVTSEGARRLNESLRAHVLESGLLGDDEGDLSELSSVEETGGRREGVPRGAEVDISEERESLDISVGIGCEKREDESERGFERRTKKEREKTHW